MKPVDEIRSAVNIVSVVGDYVKLRKSGANFVGLCPFHQEKTPSFAVHATKQIFHCFGCGVGGDVFKFVMLTENVTFPEAVERLAEKANIVLPERWGHGQDDAQAKERAALQTMHEVAARFFASQLGASVEGRAARAYLEDRGLSAEAIAHFRLGYASSAGNALAGRLSEAGFSTELMEKAGLVIAGRPDPSGGSRPFDRFRRRVIFPIANESGKVVAFAGRSLGDEEPKYLNSPETPIYTKSRVLYHLHQAGPEIRKQDAAILVEGYMDAIALASSGATNVVASCGTSLTAAQVRLLGRWTRRIVVNFDPDSAGTAATERSLGLLLEEGFEVRVLRLPGGLDPDSFIRKVGAVAYRDRLSKSPAYLDYLTERAIASHDVTTPEGKVRAANALLPYLVKVSNLVLRDKWTHNVAERLGLDPELFGKLRRAAQAGEREIRAENAAGVLHATVAEKELLWAVVSDAQLAREFLGPLIEQRLCEGLPTDALFKKILAAYAESGNPDVNWAGESLSPEEQRLLAEVQFAPGEPPDRERVMSSWRALERLQLEREQASLQAEIQRAGNNAEIFNRLSTRLYEVKSQLKQTLAPRQPEPPQ